MNSAFASMREIPLYKRTNGYLFVETLSCRSVFYDCEIQFRQRERSFTLTCQVLDVDRSGRSYSIMAFEDEDRTKPILFAVVDFVDGAANTLDFHASFIDPRMKCLSAMIVANLHAIIFHNIVIDRTPVRKNGTEKYTRWYVLFSEEFSDSIYEYTGTRLSDFISATSSLLQK